jgi:hypothetical protein
VTINQKVNSHNFIIVHRLRQRLLDYFYLTLWNQIVAIYNFWLDIIYSKNTALDQL